jgi:Endosomal/lysosomal potassium channel TMEM175
MSTDFDRGGRGEGLPSVARLLGLSDNVLAVALTLLVLQIKVPPLSQIAVAVRLATWPPRSPSRLASWSAT